MIKSTVIPTIAQQRSFSESSEGDAKPLPARISSLAVDSKLESCSSSRPNKILSFYALYSLKLNRAGGSKETRETSPRAKPSSAVLRLLDREATLNKDFSLSLIANNLEARNESYLREGLAKKIEKGTLYASTNSGNISAFNLGFASDPEVTTAGQARADENAPPGQIESICYYFLYRPDTVDSNEYLICFVLNDSEFNLDLFRNELDYYIDKCVQKYLSHDVGELKELDQLEVVLKNWYLYSVNYLVRTLHLFKENLGVFIDQILANGGVSYSNFSQLLEQTSGEVTAEEMTICQLDLELFYTSLFCTYLMQCAAAAASSSSSSSPSKSKTNHDSTLNSSLNASVNASMTRGNEGDNQVLVIELDRQHRTVSLSKTECSAFSNECAKSLLTELASSKTTNPFQLKQIIEAYKLRLIQELNTLNRFLRKAENHYYDLYKVYLYLKQSQMADVLVKMYKSCQSPSGNDNSLSSLMLTFNVVIDFFKLKSQNES